MSGEQSRPSREEVTRESPPRHGWGGDKKAKRRAEIRRQEDWQEQQHRPDIYNQKI